MSDFKQPFSYTRVPDPALAELIRRAAKHVMTPAEVRAQKLSFIVGQSGMAREEILRIMPELAPQPR